MSESPRRTPSEAPVEDVLEQEALATEPTGGPGAERDPESPDADAAEQATAVAEPPRPPDPEAVAGAREADRADVVEQATEVGPDDEDERR